MNTFIRVNGKLRKYSVDTECHKTAIAAVEYEVDIERFAKPETKTSVTLAVIEGIGGA